MPRPVGMLPSPLRAALVAAVAVVALALAGGALAYPTAPVLHPIPSTVMAVTPTYPISWDPATFDLAETYPWALPRTYYRVDIEFYRAPAPDPVARRWALETGTTYSVPLLPGYRYVLRVRAIQDGMCWIGVWYVCVQPQAGPPAQDAFDVVPLPSVDIGR